MKARARAQHNLHAQVRAALHTALDCLNPKREVEGTPSPTDRDAATYYVRLALLLLTGSQPSDIHGRTRDQEETAAEQLADC